MTSSILLDPIQFGAFQLKNRFVMAPLTRCRTHADRVPNDLMRKYYELRSSAGLIITEATAISPDAVGYPNTPGIWSEPQIQGWKAITDAVHARGGLIVLQLWHVGRVSHPSYLNGNLPVAPSAIAPSGHVSLLRPKQPFVTPRALETEEIPQIVENYRIAAQHAKLAGFDGVEVHAANGYLIDQFLQDSTNHRTDLYGGSIPNRAKFLLDVTDACISVWGPDRVGVHLAPRCDSHDMGDSSRLETFSYVASELGKRQIAFIFTREHLATDSISHELKKAFGGALIANENLSFDTAANLISTHSADAVAFGKEYIANPDLVERYRQNVPLNSPNPATFYADGETGYLDYPTL